MSYIMNLNPKEEAVLDLIKKIQVMKIVFNKVVIVNGFPLKNQGYLQKSSDAKKVEERYYIPRWNVLRYLEKFLNKRILK